MISFPFVLYLIAGFLCICATITIAAHVGTMGGYSNGNKSVVYPATIRYTQGAIALAFLALSFTLLGNHAYILHALSVTAALVTVQSARLALLNISAAQATPSTYLGLLRRAFWLALPVTLFGAFHIGWSVNGHWLELHPREKSPSHVSSPDSSAHKATPWRKH